MTDDAPFDIAAIGAGLPFAAAAADLAAAVEGTGLAVIQAPPGTGKTTVAPPVVAAAVAARAAAGAGEPGRVVVTAPRRVAVRAAARRLAQLAGVRLGEEVGYAVRGDARVSERTLVEFCTPGVLLRRLLRDAELPGVAAVVLDEVHERNLDTDLALGMLRDLRDLREDLVLAAMSATVDAPRFARLLGDDAAPAPVVDVPSVLHPLEIRHRPAPGPRLGARGVEPAFLDHVAAQAADLSAELAAGDGGDVLVFVPGVREVDHVAAAARARAHGAAEVLPLHGRLEAADQDRVVAGRDRTPGVPRIIVSTAVAESSLTVPGVRGVVDACLARGPRLDAARGMSGLVTTSCAKSSADQRAGRAARLGPGVAVRCIAEGEWAGLDAWPAPEIAVADLTPAALDLAAWGTPGGEGLRLPDAPPARHLAAAHATLRALGALDDGDQVTDLGRRLASLPVDPRLGRALLAAAPVVGARAAADAVALLGDEPRGDVTRARPTGPARSEADRLRRLLERAGGDGGAGGEGSDGPAGGHPSPGVAPVALVAALAWPDRIARRRADGSDEYLTVAGTAATAPAELRGHEWLAVAEVSRAAGRAAGRAGAVVRAAAPVDRDVAEWAAAPALREDRDVRFTGRLGSGRVTARRVERLGAIELGSHPLRPEGADCRDAVLAAIAADREVVTLTDDARALTRRLALLHRTLGDPWPDVSADALAARAEELLMGALDRPDPGPVDVDRLRAILPWPEAGRLDELAPERIAVASGNSHRVEYPEPGADGPPVLAVKLQECFGMAETPAVAGGAEPVLMHLLSPAGRPLAVTADLPGFWDGAYAQVRAEMRGRYPKHPWPEDPWAAPATARTSRAARRG
ncbi:ATP-dependent helicase HrpB [Corynebacterium sp. 335C]